VLTYFTQADIRAKPIADSSMNFTPVGSIDVGLEVIVIFEESLS
jgi:hypothetical protein